MRSADGALVATAALLWSTLAFAYLLELTFKQTMMLLLCLESTFAILLAMEFASNKAKLTDLQALKSAVDAKAADELKANVEVVQRKSIIEKSADGVPPQ